MQTIQLFLRFCCGIANLLFAVSCVAQDPEPRTFNPAAEAVIHVADGLNADGSLVKNYRRGLDYAINYFGSFGPYHVYLLGPGSEASVRRIYRERALTRVSTEAETSAEQQVEEFLNQSNVVAEIQAVLAGKSEGGLTWTQDPPLLFEDVTTNATGREKDPIENTWGALHEYHHVFQMAHCDTKQKRTSEKNINSWMAEGGATYSSARFMGDLGLIDFEDYMLQLKKSGANIGRPGINEFTTETPTWRLQNESYWDDGSAPQVYYMLGAWATAYLIHVQGVDEDVVLRDWYRDIPRIGKSAAFRKHMGLSLNQFYVNFAAFIHQSDEKVMAVFQANQQSPPATVDRAIQHVIIEPASAETPRSDTASIAQLDDDRLMVVYHKYEGGKRSGHDHGVCRIWSKISNDVGKTWHSPRMLVDVADGDMNVQAPALLRTTSDELLLIALRAHREGNSSTMCLWKSIDNGDTFEPCKPLWNRSDGQLLQGGTSCLLQLQSGRLLLPFHGGTGNQWKQKNSVWCLFSDDNGESWARSNPIGLPKRGAMEASVAQFDNGSLLMSLRTQLGGPYVARSDDDGQTWSEPEFSGLEGGESGTCLRRLPGSKDVVLFFNNSAFNDKHHHFGERTPLTCARSADHGKTWQIIGNPASDPAAEYTNLDCFFTQNGDAILTYMYAQPAWNRDRIQLNAALIPRDWFDGQSD